MEHLLVTLGNKLYEENSGYGVPLGNNPEAEKLVRDIENTPHAFVLACLMDRQINAEKAWAIPWKIQNILGSFTVETLLTYSRDDFRRIFQQHKLHRFNHTMADVFFDAIQKIHLSYHDTASEIWCNRPSSYAIVSRFLEFRGCGQKIATMAANLLVSCFQVPVSDYSAIDISADVHVIRVFKRLKLVPDIDDENKLKDMVIHKAREIHPEFPGIIDLPCWLIGREWCRPTNPDCDRCAVNSICDRTAIS